VPEFGIITSVVMAGGWHYPQVIEGGQTHRITAFSFEQLLADMLEFRQRHPELVGGAQNANIDAVRRDLKTYICAHFRQNCADAHSAPSKAVGIGVTNYQTPIDRSANWLAKVAATHLEFVDTGLANHRAVICAQCPQNIRWATPCAPCNDNIQIRVQNLKGNFRTQYDRSLLMCRSFGHVNEVAVWLKDTHSTSEHTPPINCWKLQENGIG
jgi:hypothetical protein